MPKKKLLKGDRLKGKHMGRWLGALHWPNKNDKFGRCRHSHAEKGGSSAHQSIPLKRIASRDSNLMTCHRKTNNTFARPTRHPWGGSTPTLRPGGGEGDKIDLQIRPGKRCRGGVKAKPVDIIKTQSRGGPGEEQ